MSSATEHGGSRQRLFVSDHDSGPLLSNYITQEGVANTLRGMPTWDRHQKSEVNPQIRDLFINGKARVISDPDTFCIGGAIWMLRKRSMIVDGDMLGATFTLSDGDQASCAKTLMVHSSGLKSFLILTSEEAIIKETQNKEKIGYVISDGRRKRVKKLVQVSTERPAEEHDFNFYKKLFTPLPEQ